MENFNEIINYIGRTNLFNFAIFLSVIIFLIKKVDVSNRLEQAKVSVDETIEDSKEVRVASETRLTSIEESMAHVGEEIDEILNKSEQNAKLVGEKILQEAQNTVLVIQENTGKALENSRIILKNELLKRASLASVEVARAHIINELSWNQGLHDKLIDESIEAIEGLEV